MIHIKDNEITIINKHGELISWYEHDRRSLSYVEGVLTVHIYGQDALLDIEDIDPTDLHKLLQIDLPTDETSAPESKSATATPPEPPAPIDPPPAAAITDDLPALVNALNEFASEDPLTGEEETEPVKITSPEKSGQTEGNL